MKYIPGYEGLYSITEDGNVWSHTTNKFMKAHPSKTSKYLSLRLVKDGISRHKSIHRLVGITYIKNEFNLPEIDHIDNNIYNNHVSNLRWVTRKENLYKSYNTLSPVRNYVECYLYYKDELLGKFQSINECSRYCHDRYGISVSSMQKYRKVGDYAIKV